MTAQFQITMRMKDFFFDRAAIKAQLSAANRKALSKVGAFVRQRARSNIRKRRDSSPPGSPPSRHTDDSVASLRNILFGYDPLRETMVVGPVRLRGKQSLLGPSLGSTTVPQLHEFGGSISMREVRAGKGWRSGATRVRPGQPVRVRSVNYAERPFMGPALDAERDHIPDAWQGSMGG